MMSQRHRHVNPVRRSWPRRRLGLRGVGYPGGHDSCGWWAATALPAVVSSQAALPRTVPSTSGADQRPEVSAGSLAGVVVVGVIALAAAVFVARLQQVIGLTLAAACLALITLPFQRWLQRGIGGVASMIVTAIGSLVAAITLGYVVLRDLRNQAASVADLVLARLDQVRPGSFADRVVSSLQLDVAIEEWLSRVPSIVVVGNEGGTEVGHQLVSLLAVVILAAFFQSSGRTIVDWVVARWPRDASEPEPQGARVVAAASSCTISSGAASATSDARCCWAGWCRLQLRRSAHCVTCRVRWRWGSGPALWFVVPAIGTVVGLLPLVVLLALDPRPLAWTALATAALLGLAAMYVRRRLIEPATLRVGVAPYVISVGLGIAIAGIGGSLIALVLGVVICAALTNPSPPSRPPLWQLDPRHARSIGGITVPTGWRGALLAVAMLSTAC